MSMIKIDVEIKTLPKGDTIPELVNSSDYAKVVGNGVNIVWNVVGDNKGTIKIFAKADFGSTQKGDVLTSGRNGKTSPLHLKWKENANLLNYGIEIEGCDAPLDPVIVISRKPPIIPVFLRNPFVTFVIGVILGTLLSQIF